MIQLSHVDGTSNATASTTDAIGPYLYQLIIDDQDPTPTADFSVATRDQAENVASGTSYINLSSETEKDVTVGYTVSAVSADFGTFVATPDDGDGMTMNVKGRDLITGLPKEITISQQQISEALAEPVAQIIETIKRALEQTPAELSADIVERGIMMTGGGSLLGNLDKVLRRATSLPISIAEDPLLCVVMGTGKALEEKSKLSDIFASD